MILTCDGDLHRFLPTNWTSADGGLYAVADDTRCQCGGWQVSFARDAYGYPTLELGPYACVHHWVIGDYVERTTGDASLDRWGTRGGLVRYRSSRCRKCGADRELPERDIPYVSPLEKEGL